MHMDFENEPLEPHYDIDYEHRTISRNELPVYIELGQIEAESDFANIVTLLSKIAMDDTGFIPTKELLAGSPWENRSVKDRLRILGTLEEILGDSINLSGKNSSNAVIVKREELTVTSKTNIPISKVNLAENSIKLDLGTNKDELATIPRPKQTRQRWEANNWIDRYMSHAFRQKLTPKIEIDIAERAIFIGKGCVYDFGESPRAVFLAEAVGRVLSILAKAENWGNYSVDEVFKEAAVDQLLTPFERKHLPRLASEIVRGRLRTNSHAAKPYFIKDNSFDCVVVNSASEESLLRSLDMQTAAHNLRASHIASDEANHMPEPRTNREVEEDIIQCLIKGEVPKVRSPREAILLMSALADDIVKSLALEKLGNEEFHKLFDSLYENSQLILGYQSFVVARANRQIRGGMSGVSGSTRFVTGNEPDMIHPSSLLPSHTAPTAEHNN